MTAEEYSAAADSGYVSPRIVRPEVGPMKRVKKGDAPSVGDSSRRSTKERASKGGSQTASKSKPAHDAENPSGGTETPDVVSLTVGAPTETQSQPSGEAQSDAETTEAPAPKPAKATGRKSPTRRSKAPAGAEDETPDTRTANVRFTDDDF